MGPLSYPPGREGETLPPYPPLQILPPPPARARSRGYSELKDYGSCAAPTGRVPGLRGASSSPVHRALVLVLGTDIAVLLDCSKSSRQCSLPYLLTTVHTESWGTAGHSPQRDRARELHTHISRGDCVKRIIPVSRLRLSQISLSHLRSPPSHTRVRGVVEPLTRALLPFNPRETRLEARYRRSTTPYIDVRLRGLRRSSQYNLYSPR